MSEEKKKKSWSTTKYGGQKERKRWEDNVKLLDFKSKDVAGEYQTVRLIEAPTAFARYWVTFTNKDGKETGFYAPCFNFNSDTESFEDSKYCPGARASLKASISYAANAIVRAIQEENPKANPVRVVVFPASLTRKIKNICNLNKHKIDGKTVAKDIDDPKYGMDLQIMFDPNQDGVNKWDCQKDDKTALTKEEKAYKKFDLSIIPNFLNSQKSGDPYFDEKNDLLESLKRHGFFDDDSAEDGEDEDDVPKKKRRNDDDDEDDSDDDDGPKKKKGKKPVDDDEDDEDSDDDDSDDSDDDDEEEVPKKKSKKSKDEDEDDEDDSDDDDEDDSDEDDDSDDDEEEEPKKKGKPAKKSKDDDEDEDDDSDSDDDDDDWDDEDEKPKKGKKKPADDDDEDEDEDDSDDDDSDDDEDEKPAKKKAKSKASSDDDDDWDDDEDDVKTKSKKSGKKAKSKSEEDDEEW